jgi:hypothetical protein
MTRVGTVIAAATSKRRDCPPPARPRGSTGTSRPRRYAPHGGAPRRARVPPIDYGDGLAPHLTPTPNTEITKCIQRRPHGTLGHTDRDRSEWVIGIAGMLTAFRTHKP